MKSKLLMLALMIALAIAPLNALAQDTETYTSDDGTVTFEYPAGWAAEETFASFFAIANDSAALDTNPDEYTSGQVVMQFVVGGLELLFLENDLTSDASLEDIAQMIIDQAEGGGTDFTVPIAAAEGVEFEAIRFGGVEENTLTIAYIGRINEGDVVFAALSALEDEVLDYEDTFRAVLNSISYAPLPEGAGNFIEDTNGTAPVDGEGIIWQQQRASDYDDDSVGFGPLGPVAVVDDTIYIADEFQGLRVLNLDGTVRGRITNNDFFSIDSVAASPDGMLWIGGSDGILANIDDTGTIITRIDGFNRFSGLSDIAVGPDGTVYALDVLDSDDTQTYQVKRFSPDGTPLLTIDLPASFGFGVQIAVDAEGVLYAAGQGSPITRYDADGNRIGDSFAQSALGTVPSVEEIVALPDGNILVASSGLVILLDSSGEIVREFGTAPDDFGEPMPPLVYDRVVGLAALPDGSIIVVSNNFDYAKVELVPAE